MSDDVTSLFPYLFIKLPLSILCTKGTTTNTTQDTNEDTIIKPKILTLFDCGHCHYKDTHIIPHRVLRILLLYIQEHNHSTSEHTTT